MKANLSSSAVGMFVLGAFVLGLAGYLSFGGQNIFSKPARFIVYFDESVSGLDLGAAVKLSGVRIGRVAAINVRYDQANRKALVQTICEIDRNILTDQSGRTIDLNSVETLQSLIDRGLRARLNLTGITGLLFVQLDAEDAQKYPANPEYMNDIYPVVPAVPSPISEVQQSIVEIVAKVKNVDFVGLSKDLRTLIDSTNRKVDEFDVKAMAASVNRAAAAVEAFVGSPDAKSAFTNLNAAVIEARTVLNKLDTQVGANGAELQKTLEEARAALKSLDGAADSTRKFVQAQGGMSEEITQALRQVADAAAALMRLADYLERNPNAIVVGRKPTQ